MVLAKGGVESFVAHIERSKHVEVFDKMRQKLLTTAVNFFIFVNTEGALSSPEVIKEFNMAFRGGKIDGTNPIIIHHRTNSPRPTSKEFKEKTGLTISKSKNIPSFKDEDGLVDLICDLAKTYRITQTKLSKECVKKELRLIKYLKYCVSLKETKNKLDNSILADMYIPNHCVLSKKDTWNQDDDRISEFTNEMWSVSDFLNNDNNKYIVIAAPYGVGKTYFSYKLVSDHASKALMYFSSEMIPIYIPMRFELQKIDNKGNSLESILSLIPQNRSILFIYDGLDEFSNLKELQKLYKYILNKLHRYPNSKAIITTRLNSNFPEILNIDSYVRLLPFDNSQINLFFQKYGVSLKSEQILQSGLGSNEIGKPLFCNMIAILYKQKNDIAFFENLFLNRALLFFNIIHSVVLGKHEVEADSYGYTRHQLNENRTLRKIAELKYIYGDKLTRKQIVESIKRSPTRIKTDILKVFNRLISSYFYITEDDNYEERIDFIHKSFIEYLLAEYYLECCFTFQPHNINMSLLNAETISFLEGILELLKPQAGNEYQKILRSFGFNSEENITDSLIKTGESFFEQEKLLVPTSNIEYPSTENIIKIPNLQNHRWIGIMILNKMTHKYKIENKKFFDFIRGTNNLILGNIITIQNIDLSFSQIIGDVGNYNLSGANLSHSTFHGNFYGTKFAGADLSSSIIKFGTGFLGVDFSGANLSHMSGEYPTDTSPFGMHFIDCNFSHCNMTDTILKNTSFTLSKFYKTDLSGAKLNYADISLTNLRDITLDENTDTTSINLLSKGYYFEWEDVRYNKELIRAIMEDFDPQEFDPKMKAKILQDNPEYSS